MPSRPPTRRIGPRELTRLLGGWPTSTAPAYAALAARIRLVILDGRLPVGVRLPPERELALSLGLSRTTVSAAFDVLRESGHAASRQGSGTWTTLPTTGSPVPTWAPEPAPDGVLDLAHAAPGAPPHLHAAYTAALEELPRYLPGTGYDYRGLLSLRERLAERFTERGLATTADQVLVTSGALQAVRLGLTLAAAAGDRVLVEQPGYPNGLDVVTDLGARMVPVPVDPVALTWDLDSLRSAARQTAPAAAYLVPEFQNPTGALMSGEVRERVARTLDRSGTLAVVDETLVELAMDEVVVPPPFAVFAGRTPVVTVGSASKIAWGGLRMGWLRSDAGTVARLAALRSRQDLASPVLEQLALLHLLGELDDLRRYRVRQLSQGRGVLTGLLATHLPDWRVARPAGGQVLWCALPTPSASDLAAAASDLGVRLTPGSRFAPDGGLESWVRLPFALPVDVLERAVPLVAEAWEVVSSRPSTRRAPARPATPDDDDAYVV